MALNKHWCAQGTIDSTQMIYRHILRRTRHTSNCTHIKLCSKHKKSTQVRSHGTAKLHKYALVAQWKTTHLCCRSTVENYTFVLSEHSGKLHTCAVGAQWNTTRLCSRSTVEYYTLVLSEHSGILHACAVGAQWNTTHLCCHGTTLHTKSPISGRFIDDAAISGANGCGCRQYRHWNRLVCRLRR